MPIGFLLPSINDPDALALEIREHVFRGAQRAMDLYEEMAEGISKITAHQVEYHVEIFNANLLECIFTRKCQLPVLYEF